MAQAAVARPLAEADLGDEPGLHPRRVRLADHVGERRALAAQRREALREVAQGRSREAGPDLARVAQVAVLLVVAEQQGPEIGAAAPRRGVAADHQLLLGRALELQPVA
jgi:hypothetical protein